MITTQDVAEKYTSRGLMTELLNTTGKRVERLRKDKDWNQGELAAAVNVRQNYISAIENDKATPSAEVMAAIARKLDTTLDFLMLLTDEAEKPEDKEPTFLYPETEQAARMIDAIAQPAIRAQCLSAVVELHNGYKERAAKERHIRELLALIEATNGTEYRREIERQLGLRSSPIQSSGQSPAL